MLPGSSVTAEVGIEGGGERVAVVGGDCNKEVDQRVGYNKSRSSVLGAAFQSHETSTSSTDCEPMILVSPFRMYLHIARALIYVCA